MIKKLFVAALFCALMSAFSFQTSAKSGAAHYPYIQNERFAMRALRQINSAQYTYVSSAGNGNFGTFAALRQSNLIDTALAAGFKYGYVFSMQIVNGSSPNNPSTFCVTATPLKYRKSGRRSFYLDTYGTLRGADKNGAPANNDDPLIENECASNEDCTITNLRTLHSAEVTYMATVGNSNFGTLMQLRAANLIGELLARGYADGYNFTVTVVPRTNGNPATFSISAVPITYGVTGIRSFYIATGGVIHAADHQGAPATADDPVIG